MRKRLESDDDMVKHNIDSKAGEVGDEETELKSNFDTLFKYLFCVTAQELADQLRTPLRDLGVLYDDVLVSNTAATDWLSRMAGPGPRKGQMLFAVRHLNKQEASRFEASGFRFAPVQRIVAPLSRGIHIPSTTLDNHITDMRDYSTTMRNYEPGVHLVAFLMRPTVHENFKVLTAKGVGNPLPSVTLPMKSLRLPHTPLLSRMNGWSMSTCIKWLTTDCAKMTYDGEDNFRMNLHNAIESLSSSLPPDVNAMTRFTGRPHFAPCNGANGRPCIILAFCAVGNLDTRVSNPNYIFTPFNIFRASQQVNRNSADRELASKELSIGCLRLDENPNKPSTIYNNQLLNQYSRRSSNPLTRFIPNKLRNPTPPETPTKEAEPEIKIIQSDDESDATSQQSLVPVPMPAPPPAASLSQPVDIKVYSEVRIDVTDLDDAIVGNVQRQESETTIAAGDSATSGNTYVDELSNFCNTPGVRSRPDSVFEPQRQRS